MRPSLKRLTVTLTLLWAFLSFACQRSGGDASKLLSAGISPAGRWHVASQIESDSCNLGNSVLPIGPNIDILQCGPALEVWGEGCCCPTLMGSGTVEGRVMTITLPRTINRDTSCSLAVVETDVASLSPDRFSGEATLAVSDPAGACGPGFPCQIRASFQASPCVGTECDIACLEIVCPLFLCHMISC